ncbi:SprT family metallopeptidase [Cryptosporidium hominis]|uniref:SprT family metallopeptidase n=1 Tax=Cryptosporidium hominis TaxID=237895 RepID=A0ABX5BDD8_CRYHO|nr:SprT family metallopeptidase [Cryptosporidium hominis]|eukprot:PPS95978.1 SprT family metallopeptidase [Cryptosporidium hominis]
MRPSLLLGSSVRRKNCIKNYLVSSDTEIDDENNNINTPVKNLTVKLKEEHYYSDNSNINECSSRPSISLATSVRRKVYHIDSSEDSCTEDVNLSYLNSHPSTFTSDILENLHESPTQPCIHYKSEFEPNNNPSSNYSSIGSRRRNCIFSSEEEDIIPLSSRPSIKYQSSVRRKNNSRKIFTIIDSDSEDELNNNVASKRSSFCLGPELICEPNILNYTPEQHNIWRSFDSDLEIDETNVSIDTLQELEWKTAISSSDFEDEEVERKHQIGYYSEEIESEDKTGEYQNTPRMDEKEVLPEKYSLFSDEDIEDQKSDLEEIKENVSSKDLNSNQVTNLTKEIPLKNKSEKFGAFIRQRSSIAKHWYQKFNKQVFHNRLPEEVPIKWTGRLQRTAAQTLFITNIDGSKRVVIKLSKYVLDCEFRLKKTLLHECCHVAQFLLDSCIKPPHGQIFMKWGKVASKVFPDLKVEIYHNYEIIYKYRYQCLRCFQMFGRQTKINDETKIVCSVCNGTVIFIGRGTLSNSRKEFQVKAQNPPNTQKSKSNPYSEFVKEKFAEFKKDIRDGRTPSRRAPSIMKEIAKLWKQKKSEDLIQDFEKLSIND